jgi:hypothetical protein
MKKALECFEKYKSPQTGMIHFYVHDPYGQAHDTIHLGRNFLYVLALLKSHNPEGVRLLKHLLNFQVDGLFPLYLHDYPFVRLSSDQLDICATLIAIQKEYRSLCLESMREALKKEEALSDFDKQRQKVLLALLEGKELKPEFTISSSQELSSLVCLSSLIDFQDTFSRYFCRQTRTYSGPVFKEMWYKDKRERTLFSDYMRMSMGEDIKEMDPCQMFYPLIGPFVEKWAECYEVAEERVSGDFHLTFYPQDFRYHSEKKGKEWHHFFELTKPFDPSDSKDPQIIFYLNHPEKAKVFVEGQRALVFYNKEEVICDMGECKFSLIFEFDSKEIDGVGTILRGNRPVQIVKDKFCAYDLLIALRTPRWKEGARVKVIVAQV